MEISLVLSIVALVSSVLSPVLVAFVNLINEHAVFRRKFHFEHKVEVIERYISSAGEAIFSRSEDSRAAFGRVCGEIYLYLPSGYWKMADELRNAIRDCDYTKAADFFSVLCKAICFTPPRDPRG